MSKEYKELSKEDIELIKERIEDNERCIIAIQKTSKDTDEDIEYYQKEVEALKNLINGYLMEKARADKLEKENKFLRDENNIYKNETVSKKRIRDKIKELEHEKSKRTQLGVFMLKNYENQRLLAQIEVLKSIIGE